MTQPITTERENSYALRVAVIGAGYWATNMLRVIDANTNTNLGVICDTDSARLKQACERYGVAGCSNFVDVASMSDIDAVYIATPPHTHTTIAKQMLDAGKHVLVEKPMTTSSRESKELVELAKASRLALMVGHTFLYSPPVTKVRELIDAGNIGDCLYIDSHRVNLGKYQESGVMWDLAPHDLSIILHWLQSRPVSVFASSRSFRSTGREDVAFLTLDFEGGAMAQIHVSWLAPVKLRRTTLSGSKQMVLYDDTAGPEAVKIFDKGVDRHEPSTFGEFQLSYRQGDVWIPNLPAREPLADEWQDFVQSCLTGSAPISNAETGLTVVSILEAADISLNENRRVEILT